MFSSALRRRCLEWWKRTWTAAVSARRVWRRLLRCLSDCSSAVCNQGVCRTPRCDDGVINGTETGLDCGGACGPCGDGVPCLDSDDCLSGVCVAQQCVAPSCDDGIKNGAESDVDCGGTCAPCRGPSSCQVSGDCQSLVCVNRVCQPAACDDGIRNGDETGVDCGGLCEACQPGEGCQRADDCETGLCVGNVCQAASCAMVFRMGWRRASTVVVLWGVVVLVARSMLTANGVCEGGVCALQLRWCPQPAKRILIAAVTIHLVATGEV